MWKPKKSSNSSRRPPPNRPAPAPPVEIATHNDPSQPLTSILIKEPSEKFARAKGPRRSAMKGKPANVDTTPSPLPPTAYLSPETATQRRMALRQGVPVNSMSPPMTAPLSANPYWQSPAPSHGRLSSAAGSHRGSSTGTSSVAFTSTSYYSSAPSSRGPREPRVQDEEPIEPTGPRQTLFVVNADPDGSESEPSPVLETKPFRPVLPPVAQKPSSRKKLHKSGESGRPVPPVPQIPPQFQPPPPPTYPPPEHHIRTQSEPTVPMSKSNER